VARQDDTRLFSPADLLSEAELKADARGALALGEVERDRDLDGASDVDQQGRRSSRARGQASLSRKSRLVSRSIDTVSSAMSGKWFATKFGVAYVELYSGPGRLLDVSTGKEQPGSPVEALAVRTPFTHYVFADFSQDCVDALSTRVGSRPDVDIVRGDANDPAHLRRIGETLNPRALVIAYLDPARPQDLHWATVEHLATQFDYIDLIINLPLNSLMRAILGAHHGGGRGPGVAGRSLNHTAPIELVRPDAQRPNTPATIEAIRGHYDDQLIGLGFLKPARRTVNFPAENPYYDILLASRHPRGLDLWNKTNPIPFDPKLSLLGDDDSEGDGD
jgi:three-Cys-motif partner protein